MPPRGGQLGARWPAPRPSWRWVSWPPAAPPTPTPPQDIFQPEGPNAQKIANLNFVYVLAVIVALPCSPVAFVVWKYRDRKGDDQPIPKQLHGNTRLEIMWTIAPAVLLAVVAVPTVVTIFQLAEREPDALEVTVVGQQWWWEFDYPHAQGRRRAARS